MIQGLGCLDDGILSLFFPLCQSLKWTSWSFCTTTISSQRTSPWSSAGCEHPLEEQGRVFWEFLRGKVELYPCLTSAGTTSIPSSWGHILCFHLPVNLVRTLPSLAFPILLPSTKPFPIFLRQILKESFSNFVQLLEVWSKFLSWFHFIILVPKALKTP